MGGMFHSIGVNFKIRVVLQYHNQTIVASFWEAVVTSVKLIAHSVYTD
jgi:hypothetical protein